MKLTIPMLFVAVTVVSALPRGPPGGPPRGGPPGGGPPGGGMPGFDMNNPGMRKFLLDVLMQQIQKADPRVLQNWMGKLMQGNMGNLGAMMGGFNRPKPPQPYRPPPMQHFPQQQMPPNYGMPPGNVFSQYAHYQQPFVMPRPTPHHHQQMHHHRPQPHHRPKPQNNGMLMDIQGFGGAPGAAGAPGAHAMATSMALGGTYCPPGQAAFATGSDKCKDKIIYEALYNKTTGQPLYPSWVPPSKPWDPYSIPDNVKDQAMHILIQKVMSSPTKKATLKQRNLMHALGDPPNHAKPMFGIYY